MGASGWRGLALAVVVVAVLSACGPTESSSGVTPSLVTSTGGAVDDSPESGIVTAGSTSTSAAVDPDVIVLAGIEPVAGEAPVRLAEAEQPVVYLTYSAERAAIEGPEPPASLTLELIGCSLAGPGVVVYEVSVGGEGLSYPIEAVVGAGIYAGDMGWGTAGHATFAATGRQLIVSSLPDQARAFTAVGESFLWDARGSEADRFLDWAVPGMTCELEVGSGFETGYPGVELVSHPQPLVVTAPAGTVEALAQEAYAVGDGAALLPLAVAYGENLAFYSDRWFIPDNPDQLVEIDEHLSADGCLENEFTYESYTITQQLGCPVADTGAVFEAGNRWFATASDGAWIVKVAATDRATAVRVAESLRPFWHLYRREVPLAPISEREMGRAPYGDGEVLVTVGEQRCSTDCKSPETWFYVYRIVDGTLEEYAHYPGWDRCLLVEEDEFALAIAPLRGAIEVTGPGGTEVITTDDTQPFAFIEKLGETFTVSMVDSQGEQPGCVGKRLHDIRGGIEPFPESITTTTAPSAERVITAEACTSRPVGLRDYTDEEPLHRACVDTDVGLFTIVHVLPSRMIADPPGGRECLVEMFENGASMGCFEAGVDTADKGISGGDGFSSFSALVPEGTARVVGVTSLGTSLIAIPHDRLVLLWWLDSEGELRDVIAETDSSTINLRN